MKKGIAVLLILLIAGASILFFNLQRASASDSFVVDWTKTYPTSNQSASNVVQTKNGGYAIAGVYDYQPYGQNFGFLINTDSVGNENWINSYSMPGYAFMEINSVASTNDGGFALTMFASFQGSETGTSLVKTDSSGYEIWNYFSSSRNMFPGPVYNYCSALQTNDGELVYGGTGQIVYKGFAVTVDEIFINKADLLGNQIWNSTFLNATASSIIKTSDGGFAIAGEKNDLPNNILHGGSLLIKTDALGNQLWNNTYGNFSISNLLQTSDGGFAFQGNGLLFKTDSSGNLQFSQTCIGTLSAQTNDGGYLFLNGNTLIKTDDSGTTQWNQAFGASLSSLVKTDSQDYVIAGTYPSSYAVNSTVWLTKISLTAQTPTLPFIDNFANLNSWTVVDGTWTPMSGSVQGRGYASAEALMYSGSSSWTDYQITANVTTQAGQFAGIVFRYVDSNNYYWAGIGDWGNQYGISKAVGGAYSEINGSGTASSNVAGTYILKVIVQGSTITLYVNNILVLTTTDATFGSGAIGLRTFATTIQVSSISVSVPTPTPTPSPTPTPTFSPSPTATPTPSTSSTPTPTTGPSPTPTATPTPTPSSSPTPSPTPTATTTPSPTPSSTPATTPGSTSTPTPKQSSSPSPSPSTNPTSAPISTTGPTATLSPTTELTAVPSEQPISTSLNLYIVVIIAILVISATAIIMKRKVTTNNIKIDR